MDIPEDLEITEKNFDDYFFDVRQNKPLKDQVMARYVAMADFVEGHLKENVVNLLYHYDDKVNAAMQTMRKLGMASESESLRVLKEICQDLQEMSPEEVIKKPYRYQAEIFFYTWKQCVPENNPHWEIISIRNLDEFLDADGNKLTMKSSLLE